MTRTGPEGNAARRFVAGRPFLPHVGICAVSTGRSNAPAPG